MTWEQMLQIARTDPRQIIEALFWIENKDAQIVPFKFNEVQNNYYTHRTTRDDILKARQQGFSSLILALFTVDFMFNQNFWCVCVSHESDATKRLFRKVRMYIDRLPFKIPLDTSRTDMIVNKMNGSMFYVGTAGSRAFGQGDTIHRLHLSEISRYPNAELLVKNIIPAVPNNGIIIKETTANGMNNYHHREWTKEKTGVATFKPFFFGWNLSKEYAIAPPTIIALTSEEKELSAQYGLSTHQIYWRRRKIDELGNTDSFKEQYPINELEAFISSGASAFSKEGLQWLWKTTRRIEIFKGGFDENASPKLQEDDKGYLKMWEKPLPNSMYFISADTAKSGDYSSASVWHWGRCEQVATVHGHFDPDQFGRILYKLGAMYNYAMVIPENNGIGAGTVATLRVLEYPYLYQTKSNPSGEAKDVISDWGINTNTRTRPLFISSGQKVIRDHGAIVHDEEYILEMQSFQRNETGKYEAAQNNGVKNDDRVMDFVIGMYFHQTNPMPEFKGYANINPMATPDNLSEMGVAGNDTAAADFSNLEGFDNFE